MSAPVKEQDYIVKINAQQEQIATLTKQNEFLQQQVNSLTEILIQMRKDKFGSKSEKTKVLSNQLNMFNEPETFADPEETEPIAKVHKNGVTVRSHKVRDDALQDLPVEIHEYDLTENEKICPQCNNALEKIGSQYVRSIFKYIPAQIAIERLMQNSYECPCCKKTDHPYIRKATVPTSFMPHSLASAGSVAEVVNQKYVNSMPLYRQEEICKNLGVELSRATMSNWVIYGAQNYLLPIADKLKQRLLDREVLHVDETTVQVLKEDCKKPETKSYMWVYRTGNDGRKPIVIYDYKPSRDGDIPKEFLKDFNGYLHTDGYSGYNKVKNVTRCGCWAHLRRKFIEADTASKGEDGYAKTGIAYCDKLFHIEDQLKDLPREERYKKRLELEKPLIDEFWKWIYDTAAIALPKSKLGKAIAYAINQKPYMENYLKDGRCSISNNVAENAIRPFTVGRKNWLFCDTPKGADSSAVIYSIVETAKANNINVRDYLEYLFTVMPTEDWRNNPEMLDALLPTSPEIRKKFKN